MKKLITEILVLIIFLTITYVGFTKSEIASLASEVANNYNENIDLQVLYGREDTTTSEDLLDKGTLSIKNPNRHSVTATVSLKISNNVDLSSLDIVVNGNKVNTDNKTEKDGYYVIQVEKSELNAYEDKSYDTNIYGTQTKSFTYTYDIQESFYN